MGKAIDSAAATIDTYLPTDDVGIAVDEWGAWHPEATSENGLEQENSVRDAVAAAGVLDDFNHRADRVSMANLAQTVNVLQCVVQTDETDAWPTPTYQLLELYRPHVGATALRTVVDTDGVETELWEVPLVSASATTDGDDTYVTLSNRSLEEERTVRVTLDDVGGASGEILFAGHDPADYSTSENAAEFELTDLDVSVEDGDLILALPSNSVAGVSVESA